MLRCLSLQTEYYCSVQLASRPNLPLPSSLTSWLHYLLISSLQKCSARSDKPLKSPAVCTPSSPLFSRLFSFLLVFPSMHCFLSRCQSCMPITVKPYLRRTSRPVLWGSEDWEKWGRRAKKGVEAETCKAAGVLLSGSDWHECWSRRHNCFL